MPFYKAPIVLSLVFIATAALLLPLAQVQAEQNQVAQTQILAPAPQQGQIAAQIQGDSSDILALQQDVSAALRELSSLEDLLGSLRNRILQPQGYITALQDLSETDSLFRQIDGLHERYAALRTHQEAEQHSALMQALDIELQRLDRTKLRNEGLILNLVQEFALAQEQGAKELSATQTSDAQNNAQAQKQTAQEVLPALDLLKQILTQMMAQSQLYAKQNHDQSNSRLDQLEARIESLAALNQTMQSQLEGLVMESTAHELAQRNMHDLINDQAQALEIHGQQLNLINYNDKLHAQKILLNLEGLKALISEQGAVNMQAYQERITAAGEQERNALTQDESANEPPLLASPLAQEWLYYASGSSALNAQKLQKIRNFSNQLAAVLDSDQALCVQVIASSDGLPAQNIGGNMLLSVKRGNRALVYLLEQEPRLENATQLIALGARKDGGKQEDAQARQVYLRAEKGACKS